jgi:hypothetical protein
LGFGAATSATVARVVLAVGLAAVALAMGFGAAGAQRRLLGSNGLGDEQFVAVVGAHRALCQTQERIPAGTRFLRATIGTYGGRGPLLRTSVRAGGRALLPVGTLAAGWRQGVVEVPLGATTTSELASVRICIDNDGAGRLAFAGSLVERGAEARVGGRPARGRARLEFVAGERRSGWSLAGRIASRMTFGRGLWDGLAPWAALAFVVLAAAAALRTFLASIDADPPRGRP